MRISGQMNLSNGQMKPAFTLSFGKKRFLRGSQHGRRVDGCGLITFVLVALTSIKACAEHCMNIMLNDDRKCQIPHVWYTDGPQ